MHIWDALLSRRPNFLQVQTVLGPFSPIVGWVPFPLENSGSITDRLGKANPRNPGSTSDTDYSHAPDFPIEYSGSRVDHQCDYEENEQDNEGLEDLVLQVLPQDVLQGFQW